MIWDDPLLDALEPVLAKYRDSKARRGAQGLLAAVRLAPTLEVCEALCRGGKVPVSRLDQRWAKAYRLQR